MTQNFPKPLVDALVECAELWCAAHDDPPQIARLGRLVVNDAGFFTRLAKQTKGTTTDTLNRFARFLLDPANWPEPACGAARVPQEVRDLAHRCGVSLQAAGASSGKGGEISQRHHDSIDQGRNAA